MKPYELLFLHRYDEALREYDQHLAQKPNDSGTLAGHATALLCVGRLEQSLDELHRANKIQSAELKGESQPYLQDMATVLWLLRRQNEAIKTVTVSVDGIIDGSIKFADNAGGVSQGLLLWYFGITIKDQVAINHAIKYLTRLAKKSRIKYWPGPLALLVLGRKTENDILNENFNVSSFDDAIKLAITDLLKRRELVQLLFYSGVRARGEGREQDCISAMRQCAELENPVIENEWYLARDEVNHFSS